jgi:ketosteroid isomerase-like protein
LVGATRTRPRVGSSTIRTRSCGVSEQDERGTGSAEIAALHRGIADFAGEISFRWHHRHAHVAHDVAWVNADGEVTVTPAGAAPRTSPYRLTAVLVRRDGEWRWHTFNGSEPNGAG